MNRTFTNLTSLVGADTAGRLLGLVAVAFLARTVGAEALGLLAAGMGILTYGTIVAEAGLPMLGTRKVARDMSAPQALIRQVCITRAALASGVFILCGAALFLTLNTASLRNLIIVYLLALFPSVFVIEWVFQGLKKITVLAGGRIITAFTYLLWLVLFVRQDSSLLLVPVGWITSVIAQAIYLWKQLETTDQQESQAGVSSSELLKTAWPLGLAGLIAQTVIQFPAVYLGVTDPYAGGLFNIAFRVIVLMLVVI